MMDLLPFELQALAQLLTGDHPALPKLRKQARELTVVSRELTGAGFAVNLAVSKSGLAIPGARRRILSGVNADVVNLRHGVGVALLIEEGEMSMLEGFSYDEPWPSNLEVVAWRPDAARNFSVLD